VTAWDDPAADPLADVQAAARRIEAEPGYLFNADDAHIPPADWHPLAAATGGHRHTIEVEYDAAGKVTAVRDVQTDYGTEELEPIPYADPPAIEQARPYTEHRYPAPRVSRQPDTEWTIGEALSFLDPQPPRRTISRWLSKLTPVGQAPLRQGGPLARTYRARDVMARHAQWAKNHGGKAGVSHG
jgi:YD repeat-containing protein